MIRPAVVISLPAQRRLAVYTDTITGGKAERFDDDSLVPRPEYRELYEAPSRAEEARAA